MNILFTARVDHDSSFCLLDDCGKLILYRMEERFSRKKHDLGFEYSLKNFNNLNINVDEVYITNHYLDSFLCPLNVIFDNLKHINTDRIKISSENHHLYHSYCGFYNSNFSEALCFSLDGSGMFFEDLSKNKINVDKSYKGTIIMFPSALNHTVHPFYTSDDYRISIFGNLVVAPPKSIISYQ